MIALGVVGWDSEPGDPQDEDPTTEVTLVRVTLVRHHDVLADLRQGQAFGPQILAQVIGPTAVTYTRGMRVVVALPDRLEASAGAATILGVLAHPPTGKLAFAEPLQKLADALVAFANTVAQAGNPQVTEIKTAAITLYTALKGVAPPGPTSYEDVATKESEGR